MKHAYNYPVDYSTAFLSALDITGSLAISNLEYLPKNGIQDDMNKLTSDLTALENDYLNAVEKVAKNEEIRDGQPKD